MTRRHALQLLAVAPCAALLPALDEAAAEVVAFHQGLGVQLGTVNTHVRGQA